MNAPTPENMLSGLGNTSRATAYKRYRKLHDDRSSWRNQWIELSDYLTPRQCAHWPRA